MIRRSTGITVGSFVVLLAAGTVVSPWAVTAAASPSVTAITTGYQHTCALLADHTVRCWGRNTSGELGDGTTAWWDTPVAVSGINTATAIDAGFNHTCAVLADRTVRCWGGNESGELGDGTTTSSPTPVAVSGIATATAISAGSSHTCALLADGTARCWGSNGKGQLGDGTTTERPTPVAVSGITTATAIAAGGNHACAVLADHTARCWGGNDDGQLGDNTTTEQHTPVAVFGLSTATAITAGLYHTCVLLADHTARCWGDNSNGQLGDGTTRERLVPKVVSGISTATAISAGAFHTCAVLAAGIARCWGGNSDGQLGDGTWNGKRLTPVAVTGISNATAISAGGMYTCSLMADGAVNCWGRNDYGQLGDGTTTTRLTPVAVVWPIPFTDIAGSMFKSDIEWVYLEGITTGCSATLYCPDGFVTREQMASFLARSLHLSGAAPNAFTDDDTSQHHININLVAREKIATGCAVNKYCPTGLVSREQMASFLARALKLTGAAPDAFTDDEVSIHEPNINLVAREGIATGCGGGRYCPTQNVTRGQMAAFLRRAFAP